MSINIHKSLFVNTRREIGMNINIRLSWHLPMKIYTIFLRLMVKQHKKS